MFERPGLLKGTWAKLLKTPDLDKDLGNQELSLLTFVWSVLNTHSHDTSLNPTQAQQTNAGKIIQPTTKHGKPAPNIINVLSFLE